MSYDTKYRRQVLRVRSEKGLSFAKVAALFGISKQTIYNWSKRIEEKKTRCKPATKIDMQALAQDVRQYADAYQYERAKRLGVSVRCVGYALKRLGVTYKKTLDHPKADPEKRYVFSQKIQQYKELGRPLVFIDESGFAHHMPRTHGYAPKAQRCDGQHDWGAKGRTNVIGALLGKCLLTVSLFQTNINTDIFTAWVQQDLIDKLPPQAVLIMDNAAFHKGQEMKNAVEKAGHTFLFLPPYSPDLNPIEHKWAQLKARRRETLDSIEKLLTYSDL